MADDAAELVAELRALAPGRQREVLDALDADERQKVRALLLPSSTAAPPDGRAPILSELSPSFRDQIEAGLDPAGARLTDAARGALQEAIRELAPAHPQPAAEDPAPGPSLFSVVRRLLRPGRFAP